MGLGGRRVRVAVAIIGGIAIVIGQQGCLGEDANPVVGGGNNTGTDASDDGSPISPSGDGSSAIDAPGNDAASTAAKCADAASFELTGCPCTVGGDTRDCYAGTPGPKSGCTKGAQTCISGAWGSCQGAKAPSPEVCFDDIDNDCNGVLDDGCKCTASVDICPQAGGFVRRVSLEPSTVKMGEKFQLIIISQTVNAPEGVNRAIDADGTTLCIADSVGVACAAGAGCPGWHARRIEYTAGVGPFPMVGSYTLTIRDGSGCSGSLYGIPAKLMIQ